MHEPRGIIVSVPTPEVPFCAVKKDYARRFSEVIAKLNELNQQQLSSMLSGDLDFGRFDILLHDARAEKEEIKYDWIAHAQAHGCGGM